MKASCKHWKAFCFATALSSAALYAGAQKTPKLERSATVTGSITDAANGKPLPGIQVSYKEYTAAITDSAGSFSLAVPDYSATITINGEGFQPKEIALKGRKFVTAGLYEGTYNSVYDVAYIPFGERPKNRVVNAAVSVPTNGNWTRSDETPDTYLQGQVAGLNVTRRSGTPGIGANLSLRGFTSLYATNQPLIVVDGVIFDNTSYGNSIIPGHVDNPLSFIDPKDIENITVIKDGCSTYGTKAANGVILITTGRARQLPTKIDFAAYAGANFAPSGLPVMNAADYRTYLSDLLKTGGLTDAQIQQYTLFNDDPGNPDYYRYHSNMDWQKQVFSNSMENNYYLKVSGGDDVARYSLSMGAVKNHGVIQNTALTRYNTRFNADFSLNARLKAYTNLSFSFSDQKLAQQGISPATNPIYAALVKGPFIAPHDVSAKGSVSPIYSDADTLGVSNPLALVNNMQDNSKNYRFSGALGFDYKISSPLHLISVFGITLDKVRESFFVPGNGVVHDTLPFGIVALNRSGSQVKQLYSVYADSRLTYTTSFSRIHQLSASLGIRYNQTHSEQDIGLGFNSPTDQFVTVGQGLASLRQTGGDINDWKWLNSYFSANYNLQDKYFLDLNMAADASSRFGDAVYAVPAVGNYRLALMPSVGAAWLVSSENFMSGIRWLDLLKLRATYSLTGNDDIGNYNNRSVYVSQNLLGLDGLVRGNVSNPHIQWEQVTRINVGFDAAILKERASLSADVFWNNTTKMLMDQQFNSISGIDQAWTNTGSMMTKGIEFGLTGRIINRRSLKWDVGATLAFLVNKVKTIPDNPLLTQYAGATILTQSGKTANLFYGYKTAGVYASDADAAKDGYMTQLPNGTYVPFKGGDVRFVDMNGDKIIDDKDRRVIGNPNPHFTGSFSSRVSWRRWALDALFTFSQGNDLYNYTRYQLESMSGLGNQTQAILNRWRANGQHTDIPRATLGDPMGNSRFSDRWLEDGSYIRLRNLSISYEVPLKPAFVKYALVYLSGNNLVTLTRYMGYDPETSSTGSVFGQGVDIPLEPLYRSCQVGVRIGL
jgi:TonB-linked SusC/RagA family outer membrane protein